MLLESSQPGAIALQQPSERLYIHHEVPAMSRMSPMLDQHCGVPEQQHCIQGLNLLCGAD